MKKALIFISVGIIFFACFIFIVFDFIPFNSEDTKGSFIQTTNISIMGEYVFYKDRWDIGSISKARNLRTGDIKLVGIGLGAVSNVCAYENDIYYLASRSSNPEYFLYKRGQKSIHEKKLTKDNVSDFFICNDFLYYKKESYVIDDDYAEDGNIFRIDLSTEETEKMINCKTNEFFVKDNNIYYSRISDKGYENYKELLCDSIICHSLQSKAETLIIKGCIGTFRVVENNIFYLNYIPDKNKQKGKYELLWLNLDTNETVPICNDVKAFEIFGNNICYIDNRSNAINIFEFTTNSTSTVYTENINYKGGFVLYNKKIYYYDQRNKFIETSI